MIKTVLGIRRWSVALLALAALYNANAVGPDAQRNPTASTLARLPEKVTSFGAVTHDGWLYVFGGHRGERHEYSGEMVSGSFHRLDLSTGTQWERLPDAMPGQGQPLVAHDGYIYRIGGMGARNKAGEKQHLFSTDLALRFNTRTKVWEDIPRLPAPRSSHDAVVLGDKIYVVGGWSLDGNTRDAVWPASGLVLDLNGLDAGWKAFEHPFRRRALAVAATGTRIYVLGGMNEDGKTTLAVEVLDTASGEWSHGPSLPEGRNKGFACSAIAQGGRIYANTFQGELLRLSPAGDKWEVVGRLEHPRIAHRIVTAGTSQIIALGGEDGKSKRPELELLTPQNSAPRETALLP